MPNSTCLYRGKYLSLLERDSWEYAQRVNSSGVAVIVAATDEADIILVEQFRTPVDAAVIELPAGLIGDQHGLRDESALRAAKREFYEETGYQAENWEHLLSCPASAGMSSETLHILRASGLRKTGPGGGDSSEDITVHEVPLQEVDHWLDRQQARGRLVDPKVYAALYWLGKSSTEERKREKT